MVKTGQNVVPLEQLDLYLLDSLNSLVADGPCVDYSCS